MVVYLVVEAICLDGKVGSALPTVLAMQLVYFVPGLAIVALAVWLWTRDSATTASTTSRVLPTSPADTIGS